MRFLHLALIFDLFLSARTWIKAHYLIDPLVLHTLKIFTGNVLCYSHLQNPPEIPPLSRVALKFIHPSY